MKLKERFVATKDNVKLFVHNHKEEIILGGIGLGTIILGSLIYVDTTKKITVAKHDKMAEEWRIGDDQPVFDNTNGEFRIYDYAISSREGMETIKNDKKSKIGVIDTGYNWEDEESEEV